MQSGDGKRRRRREWELRSHKGAAKADASLMKRRLFVAGLGELRSKEKDINVYAISAFSLLDRLLLFFFFRQQEQ